MFPGKGPLFAGISGVEIAVDRFDLGHGVEVSSTYAYVFAPIMMAFSKTPPGSYTPGPLVAVSGGHSCEITVQLTVAPTVKKQNSFDQINTAWWIVALLRLICGHSIELPVLANMPFAEAKGKDANPEFLLADFGSRKVRITQEGIRIETDHLEWVKKHWKRAASLYHRKKNFSLAMQLIDQMVPVANHDLYFLGLWTALEGLFKKNPSEAAFRVSSSIAAFLKDPGHERFDLYASTNKLYRERSKVAHGSSDLNNDSLGSVWKRVCSFVDQ